VIVGLFLGAVFMIRKAGELHRQNQERLAREAAEADKN
jgi:hypothetical protein